MKKKIILSALVLLIAIAGFFAWKFFGAAVKVTDWLNTEGLVEELTVVLVAKALRTVCTVLPLLAAKT